MRNIKKVNNKLIYFGLLNAITILFNSSISNVYADTNHSHITVGIEEKFLASYGGSNTDLFESVKPTLDGGIIAVGCSNSTDAGFENKGDYDAIIAKYDANLEQEWIKTFGGSSTDGFEGVAVSKDGGYIAVGDSKSVDANFVSKGKSDAIVVKYDAEGNQEWIKNWGGSSAEKFDSIAETPDGGFVVGGYSDSVDAGFINNGRVGTDDWVIIKYDQDLNQEWINSSGGTSKDFLEHMILTSDNKIIAVGCETIDNVDYSVVKKYNLKGSEEWSDYFTLSSWTYLESVTELNDGGILVAYYGYIDDTNILDEPSKKIITTKYTKDGKKEFSKIYDGNYASNTYPTEDGGYIIIGNAYNHPMVEIKGSTDIILIKCNSYGEQEWVESIGGKNADSAYSIVSISHNQIILIGSTYSTDIGTDLNGESDIILGVYNFITEEELLVEKAENSKDFIDIKNARDSVNSLIECDVKRELQDRLNNINTNEVLEMKSVSANLDIYIKSENMLSLSLDTNSVTFENYSGVADVEMLGAANLTVNSSLPYQINAYMPTEISNADGSERMPIDVLNIKEGNETDYQTFESITDKVVLKDGCTKGNGNVHSIDLKLASNQAHKADIYKTVIKFEAEQK